MGFATFVLKGIHPAAAFAWKLAKLATKLKKDSAPLDRVEKVAVFALDFLKPNYALAYVVVRSVVDKILSQRSAHLTETYIDLANPEEEITLEQVNAAFDATPQSHKPRELSARAGFFYLGEMLKASGEHMRSRYLLESTGRFDHTAALGAFYGTSASWQLCNALREYDSTTLTAAVRAEVLEPLVKDAWAELETKTREDAVDLFLM